MRKDGRRVFIGGRTTALRDPDGTIRSFLKIGQDVTEPGWPGTPSAEAPRVDHRAKNALAVVQVAPRPAPKDDATCDAAVEGRIGAPARARTLLAHERWNGAALLYGELGPFLDAGAPRPAKSASRSGGAGPSANPAAARLPPSG